MSFITFKLLPRFPIFILSDNTISMMTPSMLGPKAVLNSDTWTVTLSSDSSGRSRRHLSNIWWGSWKEQLTYCATCLAYVDGSLTRAQGLSEEPLMRITRWNSNPARTLCELEWEHSESGASDMVWVYSYLQELRWKTWENSHKMRQYHDRPKWRSLDPLQNRLRFPAASAVPLFDPWGRSLKVTFGWRRYWCWGNLKQGLKFVSIL